MIFELLISVFMVLGSFLILIAALGVLRLPDIFMRLHAATKATSLGILLLLIAVTIHYPDWTVIVKSLAIIIFIYLTIPVSASMLGKSSLDTDLPRWKPRRDDSNTKQEKK